MTKRFYLSVFKCTLKLFQSQKADLCSMIRQQYLKNKCSLSEWNVFFHAERKRLLKVFTVLKNLDTIGVSSLATLTGTRVLLKRCITLPKHTACKIKCLEDNFYFSMFYKNILIIKRKVV